MKYVVCMWKVVVMMFNLQSSADLICAKENGKFVYRSKRNPTKHYVIDHGDYYEVVRGKESVDFRKADFID